MKKIIKLYLSVTHRRLSLLFKQEEICFCEAFHYWALWVRFVSPTKKTTKKKKTTPPIFFLFMSKCFKSVLGIETFSCHLYLNCGSHTVVGYQTLIIDILHNTVSKTWHWVVGQIWSSVLVCIRRQETFPHVSFVNMCYSETTVICGIHICRAKHTVVPLNHWFQSQIWWSFKDCDSAYSW